MTELNIISQSMQEQSSSSQGEQTYLDAGALPIEELAQLAQREGRRPRPIYQVHRWFARRFGSAFRALLIAAVLPTEADFWLAYYNDIDWSGRTVLDPFVGGGTSVIEALRLNANIIGVDVDAVACAITHFETDLSKIPDLLPTLDYLQSCVGIHLSAYYQTITPEGDLRNVLHYFWVQIVECSGCGQTVEAHPHYRLAYESEGTLQWAFCPACHAIQTLLRDESKLHCTKCYLTTTILSGTVRHGLLTCPNCQKQERLIEVAKRTGLPPQWRLFALETLEPSPHKVVPLKQRHFRPANAYDHMIFENAQNAFEAREYNIPSWIPNRLIPKEGRADQRLLSYGYTHYRDLFNTRQLLHLSCLAETINGLEEPVRKAMAIAFSDHLTTNCMMTHYAFGWRRLAPLFSIRAYCHMTRPVEINPWMDGTGRGTFPNGVRQIQRAISWARSPKEALVKGGFRSTRALPSPNEANVTSPHAIILHKNSQKLENIQDQSVDLVLTDPPYFDNIAYSELSDFFLPWLELLSIISNNEGVVMGFQENLAARGKNKTATLQFQTSLGNCFAEIARVLKPYGRFVFTYQHKNALAWHAGGFALANAGLRPIQLFPLLGDSDTGLHKHEGNSTWDAVFVVVKNNQMKQAPILYVSEKVVESTLHHYTYWSQRLAELTATPFRDADKQNFYRACLTAGACNMFLNIEDNSRKKPLIELLQTSPLKA